MQLSPFHFCSIGLFAEAAKRAFLASVTAYEQVASVEEVEFISREVRLQSGIDLLCAIDGVANHRRAAAIKQGSFQSCSQLEWLIQ